MRFLTVLQNVTRSLQLVAILSAPHAKLSLLRGVYANQGLHNMEHIMRVKYLQKAC